MTIIRTNQIPDYDEYGEVEGSLESGLSSRRKVPQHEVTGSHRFSEKIDYSHKKESNQ